MDRSGVSEWAWQPGDTDLESKLEAEMEEYQTLESPFTQEYLEELLQKSGFVEITRFHGINGLFSIEQGEKRLKELAEAPSWATNNLTARKPVLQKSTADSFCEVRGRITAQRASRGAERDRRLDAHIENRGDSVWLHRDPAGQVALGLHCTGECGGRHESSWFPLPQDILPGGTLMLEASFTLPSDACEGPWVLDLVCDGRFWFSERGLETPEIEV